MVSSYKLLVNDATVEDIKLASILGWCVEWVSQISIGFMSVCRRVVSDWYCIVFG